MSENIGQQELDFKKSFDDAAIFALKSILALNSGAFVAGLAALSNQSIRQHPHLLQDIYCSVGIILWGLGLSISSIVFNYLMKYCGVKYLDNRADNIHYKMQRLFWLAAYSSAILGLSCFFIGVALVYQALAPNL